MTTPNRLRTLVFAGLAALAPMAAPGQGLFAPAIIVNDRAISNYEIQQRMMILRLFRTPGDLEEVARGQLIDERIQLFAAEQLDIVPSPEDVAAGMAEFAGRADLTTEEFLGRLEQAGVAAETFEDFVRAGVAWRDVVRARFGPFAQITEADIDRALETTSQRGEAEVLISEIILPARTAEEAARAEALSLQLSSTLNGFGAFAAAARQYSASPSRAVGGQVPRAIPLSNLPAPLANQLIALKPGEVSDPIPIPEAVAIFMLRELRDTGRPEPDQIEIEYAEYLIPGGRSPEALAEAARIADETDRCNDLYGVNKDQPRERLKIETRAPGEIPSDVALELARLDPGEVSTAVTRGANLVLLMLCDRSIVFDPQPDRATVRARLVDQRLAAQAQIYLSELKANALIREP